MPYRYQQNTLIMYSTSQHLAPLLATSKRPFSGGVSAISFLEQVVAGAFGVLCWPSRDGPISRKKALFLNEKVLRNKWKRLEDDCC